jgi:FixJ family two-component response regulator
MTAQPTIIIVDDDPRIRESARRLAAFRGLTSQNVSFGTRVRKKGARKNRLAWCSMSGYLAEAVSIFQRELSAANIHVPIIFITGYGDSRSPSRR